MLVSVPVTGKKKDDYRKWFFSFSWDVKVWIIVFESCDVLTLALTRYCCLSLRSRSVGTAALAKASCYSQQHILVPIRVWPTCLSSQMEKHSLQRLLTVGLVTVMWHGVAVGLKWRQSNGKCDTGFVRVSGRISFTAAGQWVQARGKVTHLESLGILL